MTDSKDSSAKDFKSTDMSHKSVAFSEPELPEGPKSTTRRRSSINNRRRSSFMQRMGLSFRR